MYRSHIFFIIETIRKKVRADSIKLIFKSWGLISLLIVVQFLPIKTVAQSATKQPEEYLCPQDLGRAIAPIINKPQFSPVRWGILVQTLTSGRTLYAWDEDKYFIPASNVKLLTTAAALLELETDWQISTPVYTTGQPPHLNSLRIKGQGDPTISSSHLKEIVQELEQRGVESIEKLIVDDSYFSTQINPSWEWSDIYSYYATSVSSLVLNQNTITLTLLPQQLGQSIRFKWSDAISSRQWQIVNQAITAPAQTPYAIEIEQVLGQPILKIRGELALDAEPDIWDLAVVDPAHYFLESFRLALLNQGIPVTQGLVNSTPFKQPVEQELTSLISPPLSSLLTEINRESNNLYAEVLLKILAKKLNTETDIEAIEESLQKIGISPKEYNLLDASGLSRQNLVTPKTLVKTLRLIRQKPIGQAYQSSLAVAGVNGTLANRFKNTNLQGKLWGKTGTLTGVVTLSGYLEGPAYQPLVFSIMVNNADLSSATLRQVIDEIVIKLGQLTFC